MKSAVARITVAGLAALVAGICYEQGRKIGQADWLDKFSPEKMAARWGAGGVELDDAGGTR